MDHYMNLDFYSNLAKQAVNGDSLESSIAERILTDRNIEILPLLNAAYEVRKTYHGKEVAIHILNNAANGYCPEDCNYCAQSKNSKADIEEYGLKTDDEILTEAKAAYDNGAFRYCMVFAGRGPSERRVEKMCDLIGQIKEKYPPLEICVSAGLMDESATQKLKDAGLDRLNHNLNTTESNYEKICTTHTWQDRVDTLNAANKVGLEVCSGMIVGMGEPAQDIIEVALKLRELEAKSIPINFLLPIEGTPIDPAKNLSPEFCLRVLCLFRFLNPKAEIRAAAGREYHLRSMEVMALYPANSIFLQGYLNTKGNTDLKTLQMIQDAGFEIKSDVPIEKIISESQNRPKEIPQLNPARKDSTIYSDLKSIDELRPNLAKGSTAKT